jgi:hypothetical protein
MRRRKHPATRLAPMRAAPVLALFVLVLMRASTAGPLLMFTLVFMRAAPVLALFVLVLMRASTAGPLVERPLLALALHVATVLPLVVANVATPPEAMVLVIHGFIHGLGPLRIILIDPGVHPRLVPFRITHPIAPCHLSLLSLSLHDARLLANRPDSPGWPSRAP